MQPTRDFKHLAKEGGERGWPKSKGKPVEQRKMEAISRTTWCREEYLMDAVRYVVNTPHVFISSLLSGGIIPYF